MKIPNQWQEVTLGDLVTSHWGGTSIKTKEYSDSGTPVLTKGDVKPGGIVIHGGKYVDTEYAEKKGYKFTRPGDFIVTTRDLTTAADFLGLLSAVPTNRRYLINQGSSILRIDTTQVDPRYFVHWCSGNVYRGYIKGHYSGATQIHIRQKDLMNAPVWLPSLPTQRKIASILSTYDDLIENNTRRIAILEEMAQAIYREWFVNFRFPGHENVQLVESRLGQIPEGWELSTVGSCSRVIPGFAFKSKDWQESGVPVVKIRNITDDNCVDMESADCVSASLISDRMQKFVLESGDLLIAMTGATAGKAGVLRIREPSALNQRVAKIQPTKGYRSLLWCFLIGNRELFYNLADGAAQPNMSGGQIESVPLLVPSEPLLEQFESCISDTAQLIDSLYFKNRNLRRTRDLLLPKLISGKLDVERLDIDTGELTEELEEATA